MPETWMKFEDKKGFIIALATINMKFDDNLFYKNETIFNLNNIKNHRSKSGPRYLYFKAF